MSANPVPRPSTVKRRSEKADHLSVTTTLRPLSSTGLDGLVDPALEARAEDLHQAFRSGAPFPHVVLDDVLTVPAETLLQDLPDDDWKEWRRYRDQYAPGKMICSDLTVMPPRTRSVVEELCQPRFLRFLESVTGIPKLLPDPYFEGGGLHCSGPGSTLAPHTDFHVYTRLDLYRRINVLLYLNPEWRSEDGGSLELFDADSDFSSPVDSIDPIWGRMVIFRTDDRSPHGFTRPVAPGRLRRSIALYYYTATESASFAGDATTHWKTHGDTTSTKRRARLAAYRGLLTGSRALSRLAHMCNPNLGTNYRLEARTDED